MVELNRRQLNRQQINAHLKSAVTDLTPNVLDKIDFNTPQMTVEGEPAGRWDYKGSQAFILRRIRVIGTLAAACLCMVVMAGGAYTYQNGKIDSVIGIDVNPSVELSVNKKNRVVETMPLNEDANAILEGMELKGVDLNVAVNAIIGSMVTHGYLADLENAILVTVSNDSVSKASSLRSEVVNDIHNTLEEKQVKAVVYDQQVIEEDNVKKLADEYGISYGKAYFLKELIEQNRSLSMDDMEELASLTMEEIAKKITESSYAVSGRTGVTEDPSTAARIKETTQMVTTTQTEAATTTTQESTTQESTTAVTTQASTEETRTAAASKPQEKIPTQISQPSLPVMTTEVVTTEVQETVTEGKIKVDYVDYDDGVVTVNFKTKVKWKNSTVSVKDKDGSSYSAMVGETDSSFCEIYVSGLAGGTTYTFIIGGISPKNGKQTTVKGTFETPVIGDGGADSETIETTETQEKESHTTVPESTTVPTESNTETKTETPAVTTVQPSTEQQTTKALGMMNRTVQDGRRWG